MSFLGQGFFSFSGCVFTKGSTVLSTKEPNPGASNMQCQGRDNRDQQASPQPRAWTIYWCLCTCPCPSPWHNLQSSRGQVTLPADYCLHPTLALQLFPAVLASHTRDRLTYAARRGGAFQCPEQFPSQLLHLLQVIQHRVGEVHEVVEINGVPHSTAKLHLKFSRLACGTGMMGSAVVLWLTSHPAAHHLLGSCSLSEEKEECFYAEGGETLT